MPIPASAPQPRPMSKTLDQAGTNRNRRTRHFHDGDLIAAIDDLRNVDFLEIVR